MIVNQHIDLTISRSFATAVIHWWDLRASKRRNYKFTLHEARAVRDLLNAMDLEDGQTPTP